MKSVGAEKVRGEITKSDHVVCFQGEIKLHPLPVHPLKVLYDQARDYREKLIALHLESGSVRCAQGKKKTLVTLPGPCKLSRMRFGECTHNLLPTQIFYLHK